MNNDDIRREASRILSDKDFQQFKPKGEDPLQGFWDWLKDLLNFNPIPSGAGDPMAWKVFGMMIKLALIILLAAAVAYLGYWLFSRFAGQAPPDALYSAITDADRREARDNYNRLAETAMKNGEYRLAMHYLLLAAVSMVIRDASFHATDFMTNRELAEASDFSRFRNAADLNRLLRDMVHFDEPSWFGTVQVAEADFRQFSQVYGQFQSGLQEGRHA